MIARFRRRPGLPAARGSRRTLIAAVVVVGILAIAIGEVTADVVNSGQPAALMEQRSYVAAVVPVIDESTALVPWLKEVRDRAPQLGREGLLAALGHLVSGSLDVRQQFATVGMPAPSARAGRILASVFAERSLAAKTLAGAVTLALSLSGRGQALSRMEAAAGEIRRSDREYLDFVAAVPAKARRHTIRLPKSAWASSAAWTAPALQAYLFGLSADAALALRHDLTILAVTVQPPVLRITPTTTTTTSTTTTTTTTTIPGASTSSTLPAKPTTTTTTTSTTTTSTTLQIPPANSTSWLAPTTHLRAVVVVANGGNVSERQVSVRATLTPVTPPTHGKTNQTHQSKLPPQLPQTVRDRIGSFAAGSSVELRMPKFTVRRGALYVLTVTISAPGTGLGMSATESVRVDIAG